MSIQNFQDRVTVERQGSIAHVRLDRAARKNALDLPMFEAIVEAGESLLGAHDVRAVVLSGEGGCFCAGLDVNAMAAGGAAFVAKLVGARVNGANLAQRVALIWQELPMPVIAAIDGVAFGGGLQIAAGADLRLLAPDARVAVMEARWGIIPDMGLTQTLAHLVRPDHLRELTWTGRIVDADEALQLGLVTRIVADPVQAALELAKTLAQQNPHAVRAGKRLLQQAPALSADAALVLETELQVPLLGSPNQMEAVVAGMQKRAPVYRDPQA